MADLPRKIRVGWGLIGTHHLRAFAEKGRDGRIRPRYYYEWRPMFWLRWLVGLGKLFGG